MTTKTKCQPHSGDGFQTAVHIRSMIHTEPTQTRVYQQFSRCESAIAYLEVSCAHQCAGHAISFFPYIKHFLRLKYSFCVTDCTRIKVPWPDISQIRKCPSAIGIGPCRAAQRADTRTKYTHITFMNMFVLIAWIWTCVARRLGKKGKENCIPTSGRAQGRGKKK